MNDVSKLMQYQLNNPGLNYISVVHFSCTFFNIVFNLVGIQIFSQLEFWACDFYALNYYYFIIVNLFYFSELAFENVNMCQCEKRVKISDES